MNIENLLNKAANEMCSHYYFDYYVINKSEQLKEATSQERRELLKNNYNYQFYPKYIKYFNKAAEMFAIREDFNANLFIDSILSNDFLYPPQIPQEKNWKTYLRNSQEKEIVNSSFETAVKVKDFFLFLGKRKISDLLNDYFNKVKILNDYGNDRLDLSVLCFSKSFKEFSKKENMMIDFKEEQSKINEKIKNKIKEKLNDDFFEEEN